MKPLRFLIFERSASIRALLSRHIEKAGGTVAIGSFPISTLYEDAVDSEVADAVVLSLARGEEETWSGTVKKVVGSGLFAVILLPPGDSDLTESFCQERCLFFEKPVSPLGWESLCSTLVSAIDELEICADSVPDDRDLSVHWNMGQGLDLIAVGGSAGGPEATGKMLVTVGEELGKTAVVIVQHIGEGFESDYVQWLSGLLPWVDVRVAVDGEAVQTGRVRIAGPRSHLEISEGPILRLDRSAPPEHGHRPSVNRLFNTLALSKPRGSAGVLLSGMGVDGVDGLQSLSRAGCLTMVQDRTSSTVFGMPRVALERGAASISRAPEELGNILRNHIEAGRRR